MSIWGKYFSVVLYRLPDCPANFVSTILLLFECHGFKINFEFSFFPRTCISVALVKLPLIFPCYDGEPDLVIEILATLLNPSR